MQKINLKIKSYADVIVWTYLRGTTIVNIDIVFGEDSIAMERGFPGGHYWGVTDRQSFDISWTFWGCIYKNTMMNFIAKRRKKMAGKSLILKWMMKTNRLTFKLFTMWFLLFFIPVCKSNFHMKLFNSSSIFQTFFKHYNHIQLEFMPFSEVDNSKPKIIWQKIRE